MSTYALLVLPSANRVYGRSAVDLTRAELEVVSDFALGGRITNVAERTIAGIPYVAFDVDGAGLSERDVLFVSNLSALYALFEIDGDNDRLRPIEVRRLDRFDDDLVTIQRYAGKTNEQFTKLLLNVTLLCSRRGTDFVDAGGDRTVSVLDPLCGRGTTLNQAMMYGFDATGVELDGRAVDAYETFLKTWLRDKRLKHRSDAARVRRDGKTVGRRFDITLSATREEHEAGSSQRITVVHEDTRHVADHFRKGAFDVIVADLPYGVQHGSKAESSLARSPLALVTEALPAWTKVLASGGAVGLAWNTRVLPRADLAAALEQGGLKVVEGEVMSQFSHRVDQSIQRDLIVATRT